MGNVCIGARGGPVRKCFIKCVNNHTIGYFGQITHQFHVDPKMNSDYLQYKILSVTDMKNATIVALLDAYLSHCRKVCVEHVVVPMMKP